MLAVSTNLLARTLNSARRAGAAHSRNGGDAYSLRKEKTNDINLSPSLNVRGE